MSGCFPTFFIFFAASSKHRWYFSRSHIHTCMYETYVFVREKFDFVAIIRLSLKTRIPNICSNWHVLYHVNPRMDTRGHVGYLWYPREYRRKYIHTCHSRKHKQEPGGKKSDSFVLLDVLFATCWKQPLQSEMYYTNIFLLGFFVKYL